jgi:4-hydroxy-3-methylbut-2-enyl diphosphate reductase
VAYLVDDEEEVDPRWLEGVDVVGLTSGASAPEWLVERMLAFLAGQGATEVEEVRLTQEHLRFSDVRV